MIYYIESLVEKYKSNSNEFHIQMKYFVNSNTFDYYLFSSILKQNQSINRLKRFCICAHPSGRTRYKNF